MMMGADTLLIVGSSFPYAEVAAGGWSCRAVQIDIDGRPLGMRHAPTECNLVGSAKDALRALIPLRERKSDRSWRERLEGDIGRWWRLVDDRAHLDAQPINPQLVFAELSPRLPENCMLTSDSDSGSATNRWAGHLRMRKGMQSALSGTLGLDVPGGALCAGGEGVPGPPGDRVDRRQGDTDARQRRTDRLGALSGSLEQQAARRRRVAQQRSQVRWEQRVMAGDPKLQASQVRPDFNFASYAEVLGLKGIRVERPKDVGPAWDEALAAQGVVVYEAITDPEVPPRPPHINFKQAKKLAQALPGDPHAGRIIKASIKGKLEAFITRVLGL